MNCLLFGLGPHAKRIYLEFLEKENFIDKVIIVDLVTEKARIEEELSKKDINYELVLFDNFIRNVKKLPPQYEEVLKKKVVENNINKAIIQQSLVATKCILISV